MKIGIKMCKDSSIVPIDGPYGLEKCIVVLIEVVNDDCEQWKLLCPIPNVKYCRSTVGIEVFWPCKYLSMNDEVVEMAINQCHVIMDGVNNLSKKQISAKMF